MSRREACCPECGGTTGWDAQDRYRIGRHVFTERLQVCLGCGWAGTVAFFPWNDNPPMELYIQTTEELLAGLDNAVPIPNPQPVGPTEEDPAP